MPGCFAPVPPPSGASQPMLSLMVVEDWKVQEGWPLCKCKAVREEEWTLSPQIDEWSVHYHQPEGQG